MPNKYENDHDRLIKLESQVDVKLNTICNDVKEIKNTIKCYNNKCDEERGKRPTWGEVLSMVIIITSIGGLIIKFVV